MTRTQRLLIAVIGIAAGILLGHLSVRAQTANPYNPFRVMLQCTGTQGPLPKPAAVAPKYMPKGYTYSMASCTIPIVGIADTGLVVGWACSLPDADPYVYFAACRHPTCGNKEMMLSAAAIPVAADPREAWRQHQEKYVTENFFNMCDVWGHPSTDWRDRFMAATDSMFPPPVPPAVDRWVVAKSGTATTRTAYLVNPLTLKRGVADGQVRIGDACDCQAFKSVEGSIVQVTYCAVAQASLVGTTNTSRHVSSCVKAQ